MKMFEGIQTFLDESGDASCYALCILKLAEKITGLEVDVIATLCGCINQKFIKYNWDNAQDSDNFFVVEPAKMLEFLTSKKWAVSKEEADYVIRPGEHIVDFWQKKGETSGHFRLPYWDSLKNSQTVKFGKITSTRVFKPV